MDFDLLQESRAWNTALNNRDAISPWPAVYAICTTRVFGRIIGTSKVVYIGSTGILGGKSDRARLRTYRYPNGTHAHGIRDYCERLESQGFRLFLRWNYVDRVAHAREAERKFLAELKDKHGELPPLNAKVG